MSLDESYQRSSEFCSIYKILVYKSDIEDEESVCRSIFYLKEEFKSVKMWLRLSKMAQNKQRKINHINRVRYFEKDLLKEIEEGTSWASPFIKKALEKRKKKKDRFFKKRKIKKAIEELEKTIRDEYNVEVVKEWEKRNFPITGENHEL